MIPIKDILANESPDNLAEKVISRKDKLPHLLLSDVDTLIKSLQKDFPDLVKVHDIGKSVEGRSLPIVEISTNDEQKPAILLTAATHARELISTSVNTFEMLKLIQMGFIQKDPFYEKMLEQNRYYFMPIVNVDGVAMIEEFWKKDGEIIPRRKNMSKTSSKCKDSTVEVGVDLNRNFAVNFGEVDKNPDTLYATEDE